MAKQFKYLGSYAADTELIRQVLALLYKVFPFFLETEQAARRYGLRWEDVTTPFVRCQNQRVVAHVGVLHIPLVIAGRATPVGGVHAVSCHPDYLRQGLFRSLMEEVLPWCDARYQTLLLTTSQPELYTPFGFRVLQEHFFVSAKGWQPSNRTYQLRELDRGDPDDLALLHRLLAERVPVSDSLGVREKAVFLFNTARFPVFYSVACDCLVYYQIEGQTLRLYDVVGQRIPALDELVELMATPLQRVEVYFTPDKLQAELTPDATPFQEPDFLMARGPFPLEGQPFILPVTARC